MMFSLPVVHSQEASTYLPKNQKNRPKTKRNHSKPKAIIIDFITLCTEFNERNLNVFLFLSTSQ